MRLAIQTLLLPGANLEDKFCNAARYGFDAVEIVVNPQFELAQNQGEVRRAMRASGLPVSNICTHPIHDPLLPDPAERRARLAALAELVRLADDLEASGVISVPVRPPYQFPDLSPWKSRYELLKALTIETLGEWAAGLAAGQAALFLEPLNRYEAYFLNRVEQAVEICRAVNHPRVKLLADFFHMNIEERDFSEPLRLAGDQLGMVHIADNNRTQPGRGCMDYRPGFVALKQIGYVGYISIECWTAQGVAAIEGDPETALPETVGYLREVWRDC
ncbi:MAG: sugar phosphate isomerase/epimerase [Anaerolineales bacterium]|nr:sugar phosphate isomerase/epimerase [Anaerolineales bacterium]